MVVKTIHHHTRGEIIVFDDLDWIGARFDRGQSSLWIRKNLWKESFVRFIWLEGCEGGQEVEARVLKSFFCFRFFFFFFFFEEEGCDTRVSFLTNLSIIRRALSNYS